MADQKITITAKPSKIQQINVTSNRVANEIVATPDTSLYYSNLSKQWATKIDGLVVNEDYSSKYYAEKSKQSAETAKMEASTVNALVPQLQENFNDYNTTLSETTDNAITEINTNTTGAVSIVEQAASKAVSDVNGLSNKAITEIAQEAQKQIDNIESTGFYMRDDKLYFINSEGVETEFESGGGSGFNLFDTKTSDHILEGEEALGWALQGTYVYKEGVAGSRTGYADFYNKCLAEKENSTATETTLGDNTITMYVNGNGHTFYDIANKDVVDTFYNAIGTAWFYGIDTTNERIFLPRNDHFVQLTGDTSQVGDSVEAGLPNIDGYLKVASNAFATEISGAFARTSTGTCHVLNQGTVGANNGVYFDASASNNIYGKSDTVQPNAVKQLLYICVGNTKVESAISNVTEITTSENDTLPLFYNFYAKEDMTTTGAYVNASLGSYLSGNVYPTAYEELVNKLGTGNVKANTDTYTDYDFVVNQDDMTFRLPLLNGDRVLVEKKEATTEDPTWYNLYNDGWCEQGGILANYNGADATIAFLIPFTNTDYSIFKSYVGTYTGAWQGSYEKFYDKTIATIKTYGGAGTDTYCWEAKGYADVPTNTGLNLYYKLSNAVTNLELLDVAKVMNEAVLKSSLVEANVIVESYVNGTSGYNVYSNGYCEQWGCYKFKGVHGTSYTITLLKEMKDTDYLTYRGGTYGIGVTSAVFVSELSKATDSFVIYYGSQTGGSFDVIYNWKACGYIK